MLQVINLYDETKRIFGSCDDATYFRWLTDAVNLIANKADFEGWRGYIDLCTTSSGLCVSMPREVGTVLAVNIGGRPTVGFNETFLFHLNGPGDCSGTCSWSWYDEGGLHFTYRDIVTPSKLVAYVASPADEGKKLVVHGFDQYGNKLRRQVSGEWLDGYQVPTVYGYSIPDTDAPVIARITGVVKDVTAGNVRLATIDASGVSGAVLGVYEPDETLPKYRRIKLGRSCDWVRVAYRKAQPTFISRYDRVELQSRFAIILAVQALKFYRENDLANAHAYEADAARIELEAQRATETPTYSPPQILDWNNPQDKTDYDIR